MENSKAASVECTLQSEIEEPQQGDGSSYERRERFGNNRYHQPKSVSKSKRKAANKSKQRNRRK